VKAVYQVRVHGRGGQGVVTAAELIASAAIADGKYAQAFPSFGSERTGAPVAAYCRIDDKPIRSREPVADPDAVLVLDATLLRQGFVFDGLKAGGTALVNATGPVPVRTLTLRGVRVHTLPATEIARERIGRPLPNAAMVGAFAAAGIVSLASVRVAIAERFHGRVAEANGRAAADAYEHVLRGGGESPAPEEREAESV
jgi:pyruvate ferredoxin oxidoreductase gamma subunit